MSTALRVLFVEDTEDDADLVLRELRRNGYEIASDAWTRVETAHQLRHALKAGRWDLIISDYQLPSFTGPEALAVCNECGIEDTPFLMVSGTVGEEQAVTALRAGARDFISKHNLTRLGPAVARELRDAAHRMAGRKAAADLLQAQKMDAVGQLAGGVAHDLNNILGVIMGTGEMLARRPDLPEVDRQRVKVICDATERAGNLVRQLLTFSRRQIVQPKILDLNDVVRETMGMLERIVGEHIEVDQRLAADLWSMEADGAQVQQVVMNLVINARDAMPNGGRLTIATQNTSGRPPVAPGGYVRLEVTDAGCGMDGATLSRMFEPFFTTKEPGQGTGLGLATVYGIVTQAGGHFDVESTPGAGTRFQVYWPRAERAATAASVPVATAPAGGNETILLLEDDLDLRMLIQAILGDAGYRVLVAEHVEDAIDTAKTYKGDIHMLLTDVVMPRLRGTEVARQVRELRPAIAVIFMSGYASRAGEALRPLLVKPFPAAVLLNTARDVLDGRTV